MDEVIGKWSFIIGLVIAIVAGFVEIPAAALILLVLGLIVGFLNIAAKETTQYLIAAVALIVGAGFGLDLFKAEAADTGLAVLPTVGPYIEVILANFIVFVAAAALIVAIKGVIELSSKSKKK